MKKPALVLALVIIVVAIGSVFVIPRLRLASLERSLYTEPDTKAKAVIAMKILESNSEQGLAALQKYADQDRLSAFDATHNLLLLCDSNGSVHVAYVGLDVVDASTEEELRDKEITEAIRKMYSMSFSSLSFGEPPMLFEDIHLLPPEKEQASFILKQEAKEKWKRLSFKFEKGGFSTISYEVTDTELDLWRKNENWPEAWKSSPEGSDSNSDLN